MLTIASDSFPTADIGQNFAGFFTLSLSLNIGTIAAFSHASGNMAHDKERLNRHASEALTNGAHFLALDL